MRSAVTNRESSKRLLRDRETQASVLPCVPFFLPGTYVLRLSVLDKIKFLICYPFL
jgi:hypothetical protein